MAPPSASPRLPRSQRQLSLGALLLVATLGPALDEARLRAPPPETESTEGRLLVAAPTMRDPRFTRAVIYVVKHDAEGAIGVRVNQPQRRRALSELLAIAGKDATGAQGEVRVYQGGPVADGQLFALHTPLEGIDSLARAKGGLAISDGPALLERVAQGDAPRRLLFAVGHVGWAPGQLDAELRRGGWVVVASSDDLVFGAPERAWPAALQRAAEALLGP